MRIIPTDVKVLFELHEENSSRVVRTQPALGLVDFYSEDESGTNDLF